MDEFTRTERTKLRRLPARGVYDRERVYEILDEGLVCHVGFTDDKGWPFVIPTAYGRSGDWLYLHGSAISRTLERLGQGVPVCVTVTLIDGMVIARSAFHHSMNYRSAMVFGTAEPIEDDEEKLAALAAITNHLLPGRWDEVRETTRAELNATSVLRLPLEEVSAKIRTGGPKDAAEDEDLPIWAGVVPVSLAAGAPWTEGSAAQPVPDSVTLFGDAHCRRDR